MTARGVEFLQNWIVKNVSPADQGETQAAILASACIIEAASQGIVVAHMEEGGPNIETQILEAMIHLSEARTHAMEPSQS
jgi:hypothetical protein